MSVCAGFLVVENNASQGSLVLIINVRKMSVLLLVRQQKFVWMEAVCSVDFGVWIRVTPVWLSVQTRKNSSVAWVPTSQQRTGIAVMRNVEEPSRLCLVHAWVVMHLIHVLTLWLASADAAKNVVVKNANWRVQATVSARTRVGNTKVDASRNVMVKSYVMTDPASSDVAAMSNVLSARAAFQFQTNGYLVIAMLVPILKIQANVS